jgi:hypothetical protein
MPHPRRPQSVIKLSFAKKVRAINLRYVVAVLFSRPEPCVTQEDEVLSSKCNAHVGYSNETKCDIETYLTTYGTLYCLLLLKILLAFGGRELTAWIPKLLPSKIRYRRKDRRKDKRDEKTMKKK